MHLYNKTKRKMINYDDVKTGNMEEHNANQSQIFDQTYRILIICGSGSGQTNANLVKQQIDNDYNIIDKIYLFFKDPNQKKY